MEDCNRRRFLSWFHRLPQPLCACVRPNITPIWRGPCAAEKPSTRMRCSATSTRSDTMATDVVEMPGEYALRGGILDVYSPEDERPVRIELFGDEVESIRKFDPATQRSSNSMDEALLLLPLTETPVSEGAAGCDARPSVREANHR